MFLIYTDYYETRVIPSKGRGIFALKEIEAGTIIGDYLGILIREEDEEIYDKKYGSYTINNTDKSFIFPLNPKEPGIHLINHSCASNCVFYPIKNHITFCSTRKIFPGEELSLTYFLSPPNNTDQVAYPCFCESPICRGSMYVSNEKFNRLTDYTKKLQGEFYYKEPNFGEVLKPFAKYPKNIADMPVYDLYANHKEAPINYNDSTLPDIKELRSRIRTHGRILNFKKINIKVYGVTDKIVILI